MQMIDFLFIARRTGKHGVIEIYPKFIIKHSKDLMIRGGDFYAIWLQERGLWSTDEQDALQLIDRELDNYADAHKADFDNYRVLHMWDAESGMIDIWHRYCQRQMRDSFVMLDEKLIFANTDVKKEDYASKRLPYPLEQGSIKAWNELMSVLYAPDERMKIEWAIGAIVNGDSKKIQKFIVMYGAPGTGKSTVINIIQKLFTGYYSTFDSKALGSSSNAFALEAFKSNPLIAIQHDGDLSRIEDNTRINSLVSHESMMVNEKFKSAYENRFKCFLILGTNNPVRITNAKSGIIRRLIDVEPSGNKVPGKKYEELVSQIDFELGAIAWYCRNVYENNKRAYDDYIPKRMLGASNDFYNFMEDSYYVFKKEDGVSLKVAWEMYKAYCSDSNIPYPCSKRVFKEELMNYFHEYKERVNAENGDRIRSYYSGFRTDKFEKQSDFGAKVQEKQKSWIDFKVQKSILDDICKDCPAQYANENGTPTQKWENVQTKLADLDTSRLHYLKVPENHIVIDFDIPGDDGKKSLEKNLEAASKWPKTYAELSKSGAGIHLHYIYSGDASKLSRIYDEHIEIKVFTGKSSLRRKLSKCNDIPVAPVSSGLPMKGEKMVNVDHVQSENALRVLIMRNLNKEIHPYTKPSIDFIYKILEDAYNSDLRYDVDDMRNSILGFAASSTNQADACLKIVSKMHFKSKELPAVPVLETPIVFFDCEVFPNLLLVNWKFQGSDKSMVHRMINPSADDIAMLAQYRLIGFNNRKYDTTASILAAVEAVKNLNYQMQQTEEIQKKLDRTDISEADRKQYEQDKLESQTAFLGFAENLADALNLGDTGKQVTLKLAMAIQKNWTPLKEGFNTAMDKAFANNPELKNKLTDAFKTAFSETGVEVGTEFVSTIVAMMQGDWANALASGLNFMIDFLNTEMGKDLMTTVLPKITELFSNVGKAAKGAQIGQAIGEMGGEMAVAASEGGGLIAVLQAVAGGIGSVGTAVAGFVAEFWPFILAAVAIIAVLAGIAALVNKHNGVNKELAEKEKDSGADLDINFAWGINAKKDKVDDAVTAMTQNAVGIAASAAQSMEDALNEDWDYNPTIRPVVDLTEVWDSAEDVNSAFAGEKPMELDSNLTARLAKDADRAYGNQNETGTDAQTGRDAELLNAVSRLGDHMDAVGESIRGMKVVMDGRKTVGYIDSQLGVRAERRR